MLRNKKFQIDKLFIIILLLISGILSAQENKTKFKIQYSPDIIDSWWLEKNNFGIQPTKFDFGSTWRLKKNNFTYSINILFQEDKNYICMSDNLNNSLPFKAACDLIFEGKFQPSGYTEPILHKYRTQLKNK